MRKHEKYSLIFGILIFLAIGFWSFYTSQDEVFLIISIFGTLICSAILMSESVKKSDSKKRKKLKSNITALLLGLIFVLIPLSIFLLDKRFDIFITIALLFFIVLGIGIVFTTLFMWNRNKMIVLRVEEIDRENKMILFKEENASKFNLFKCYKYKAKKLEKFNMGDKFEINLYEYGVGLKTDDPSGIDGYEYIEPEIPNILLSNFKDSDFKKVY